MTHVNRWRTITATATTAVLAAGAFGISAASEGSSPDPIAVEAGTTVPELVEDSESTLELSVQSTASQVSGESADEALNALSDGPDVAGTELQSDATASTSAADATSLPSEDSESLPSDDSESLPSEESQSVEDSVSVEDADDDVAGQAVAPAGDDTLSVDDGDEDSLDSAS